MTMTLNAIQSSLSRGLEACTEGDASVSPCMCGTTCLTTRAIAATRVMQVRNVNDDGLPIRASARDGATAESIEAPSAPGR